MLLLDLSQFGENLLKTSTRNKNSGKQSGFTLAEVLITLGIIGVVAAMTIPTLVQKHKKHVIISTLKKTSSAIRQAFQLGTAREGYIGQAPEGFEGNNPDAAEEMFNKYYSDLKIIKTEKGSSGLYIYLTDGTVLYFRKTDCGNEPIVGEFGKCLYFFTCINNKACNKLRENEDISNIDKVTGKDIFLLYSDGSVPKFALKTFNRNVLLYRCKNNMDYEACTALIFVDGWDIKDDYPIKL